MADDVTILVREVISRPHFRNAEVVASSKALDRKVKWVHVMEVARVGELLNGGELILSTGVGWQDEESVGLSFLSQLIDSDASGLCIELGTYTRRAPERMKELAVLHDFPLIFFHEEVRYVDITRDLHTMFINRRHRMMTDLDTLTDQFNRILLSGKGLASLLRLLHERTRKQVAFLPTEGEPYFVPAISRALQRRILIKDAEDAVPLSQRTVARSIPVLQRKYADVMLFSNDGFAEYDELALDRCATAVAQEMMRTVFLEERRRFQDDHWIQEWLRQLLKETEIAESIYAAKPNATLGEMTVCVFEMDRKAMQSTEYETAVIGRVMQARTAFEREGCLLIPTTYQKQFVCILIDQQRRKEWKGAVMKAAGRLLRLDKSSSTPLFTGTFGIGAFFGRLHECRSSYDTAAETISVQKTIGPMSQPFYAELHVYRVLSQLAKTSALDSFVAEYLGPLIAHERKKPSQLLRTLQVYLRCSGSKQETANALFIVRQTLYHRLSKIAELLGEDFMKPEKRFMLELALYAYEYKQGPVA
ncbi:PucR family transcriptional regulator [Paenibacillus sp. TRM 82003]|nr:PucR family transcriptional regulator [Paenibacillus sp. TRM 82003]